MTATEYSVKVGRCKALLSVYRKNRGMPKKTPSRDIYIAYISEVNEQNVTRDKFQELYFELKEAKSIRKFGLFLEGKGIMTHKSLQVAFGRSFRSTERLIGSEHVKRFKQIIKLYEEWKCQTSSTS